jgi:hypothetical protein
MAPEKERFGTMTELSRRQIIAGAAASAAVAAMPAAAIAETTPETAWPAPPYVDRQTHFDGRVDWTFYARRREWVGIDRELL